MSNPKDSYLTVSDEIRVNYAPGKCRFIATLAPVKDEKEARSFIDRIKEEFPDATHNTYAYRLGIGDNATERCSDDREPAGTAGPPVLGVIHKYHLTGIAIVVTRYFGGVKLGVGGLIRAYRGAAEEGVKNARLVRKVIMRRITVIVPYDSLGAVMRLISSQKGEIISIDYANEAKIECLLRPADLEKFNREVSDATRGQGTVKA